MPVGRIGDLKVQIKADDMKALLTWTSPDMGGNRVSRYSIRYATTITDIVDNYETVAVNWEHATPHALAPGSETTVTLDMGREKHLLDKPLYFAVRAFPQMYSDNQAAPVSNWVRVVVPSPPPPPTVPPTYNPHENTIWPNQFNSVGIDPVSPSMTNSVNLGLEIILPVSIGIVILAIVLSLYCYFCVMKKRGDHAHKKPMKVSNGLKTDKLTSAVTIVPSSPLGTPQHAPQGYVNHSDLPDHHTVGVPINSYTYDCDEPKKRYSLVHQQEQQLIEELKQQQMQREQNPYGGLSVISNNAVQQRNGVVLSPYNSWSASQLLHEHERRHSPIEGPILEDEMLVGAHQEDHYNAPPVPPLPAYSSNGYPANYNVYGTQNPIYQSMQRNEPMPAYSASLQGSLSSVNSGEKKRRNVTMV